MWRATACLGRLLPDVINLKSGKPPVPRFAVCKMEIIILPRDLVRATIHKSVNSLDARMMEEM